MDFGSLLVLGLIIGGVIVIRRQVFRFRALRFGRQQARALEQMAQTFPNDHSTAMAMKKGETFVYQTGAVSLVETRTGARRSRRTLGALTFRVAPGVYATGGGGGSVSPPPPEQMTAIDQGYAVFSDKRVVFVGGMHSRQWDFDKMLGATPYNSSGVLIAVSNRQKMSGIVPTSPHGVTPWVAFQIAGLVAEHGAQAAKEHIAAAAEDAKAQVAFLESNLMASQKSVEQFQTQRARHNAQRQMPRSELVDPEDPHTPATVKPGQNPATIDVVGESFYPESMAGLREYFRTKGKSEHIVEAELRCDPDNPHSSDGKAVAVYIREMKVGHIPSAISGKVFDQVDAQGGSVMIGARLWLDEAKATPNKSSVTLFLDSRLEL